MTLDQFVERGGRIIATGSTGFGPRWQRPTDVIGAPNNGSPPRPGPTVVVHLCRTRGQRPVTPTRIAGPIAPIYGAYHYCAWSTGAEHRYLMLARAPIRSTRKGVRPPAGRASRLRPVASRPGAHRRCSVDDWARLSRPGADGRARPDPGPSCAICSATTSRSPPTCQSRSRSPCTKMASALVVHLVNMSGARPPVSGSRCRFATARCAFEVCRPPVGARALVADAACAVTPEEDG